MVTVEESLLQVLGLVLGLVLALVPLEEEEEEEVVLLVDQVQAVKVVQVQVGAVKEEEEEEVVLLVDQVQAVKVEFLRVEQKLTEVSQEDDVTYGLK